MIARVKSFVRASATPRALCARLEFGRRHEVYRRDAYAWALYANREYAEARQQIEKALAVGLRDAKLFYHAGAIASKLDDRAAAARYLKQSLDLNSISECSAAARKVLARLEPASEKARRVIKSQWGRHRGLPLMGKSRNACI